MPIVRLRPEAGYARRQYTPEYGRGYRGAYSARGATARRSLGVDGARHAAPNGRASGERTEPRKCIVEYEYTFR
jgi:hypothetical protein